MESSRLLFPFTHGVDTQALGYAVQFAASRGATLVALSLIAVPESRHARGASARLEHIQQSQDFLSVVRQKAACHVVELETYEVYTCDVVGAIVEAMRLHHCAGTLLFMRAGEGVFLQRAVIKQVMREVTSTHSVVHLPERAVRRPGPRFTLPWHRLGVRRVSTETALP
jgi:hypothetical protein